MYSLVFYSSDLHWLHIKQRIQFKTCVFVFNCLRGDTLSYSMELFYLRMREPRLRRPTDLELVTSLPKGKVDWAAFSIAGPVAWNSCRRGYEQLPL